MALEQPGDAAAAAGQVLERFPKSDLAVLLTTFLLTVLVVALSPHGRGHQQELELERRVEVGLGLFFWVLIGGLIAAIVAGYR